MALDPTIIKTDDQYRAYLAEVERLASEDPEQGTPDGNRLELLAKLVEDYEKERVEAPKSRGLDMLRHLLAEHGMSAADLARLLKAHRSLGAMILRGERHLTLAHVAVLARHFAVSADLFLPGK